jgi:hypothetical protein
MDNRAGCRILGSDDKIFSKSYLRISDRNSDRRRTRNVRLDLVPAARFHDCPKLGAFFLDCSAG